MKGKALLFAVTAILFLISKHTNAQTQVWEQTYSVSGSRLWLDNIVPHSTGIYACGEEKVIATDVIKLRVTKHNYSGGLLYTNAFQFGSVVQGCKAVQTMCDASGNIYILVYVYKSPGTSNYSDCYVLSYSPALALRWASIINFDYSDEQAQMMITTGGTLFAVVQFRSSSGPRSDLGIKRINMSTGTVLYSSSYSNGNYLSASKIIADANGNAYVCGSSSGTGFESAFLLRFNSAGSLQWASYYTPGMRNRFQDVTLDNFGNAVYTCGYSYNQTTGKKDAVVLKYNTSGANTASYVYSTVSDDEFLNIDYEVSGSVIMYGYTKDGVPPGGLQLCVIALNTSLSAVLSSNNYMVPMNPHYPIVMSANVIYNPNGTRLVIIQTVESYSGISTVYSYLVKISGTGSLFSSYSQPSYLLSNVDLSPYSNTDYITGQGPDFIIRRFTGPAARYALETNPDTKTNVPDLTTYPNPASTFTTLSGIEEGSTVNICDMSGKQCMVEINVSEDGNAILNVQNLDDGTYILQSSKENKTIKLVVKH